MSETIVAETKPDEIHRFRCLGCGRVFDTFKETPTCCGDLQELEIPPPTISVKPEKEEPKEPEKSAPIIEKGKSGHPQPKPGVQPLPLDDPLARRRQKMKEIWKGTNPPDNWRTGTTPHKFVKPWTHPDSPKPFTKKTTETEPNWQHTGTWSCKENAKTYTIL